MIDFRPYHPHDPYTQDTIAEVEEQLQQTYKAIDRAELNLLICDIMISKEKPTQEVINGFADKIERIMKNEK